MCSSQDWLYRAALEELEGICVSPFDSAKWAAMIFGYFDESGAQSGEGFVVVAGFIGKRKDWKNYLKLWREELGPRKSLHMKKLRLGWPQAPKRYGDLLRRLGSVPHRANLKAFAGSVSTAHYAKRIKGTIAEIGLAGYEVALVAMVDAILESKKIPRRDRIEFAFEDQKEFAVSRALTFHRLRREAGYKTHHGKSRVGKDSSMEKGPLLEASDYLAYAVLQHLLDSESQKAELTSPILSNCAPIAHTTVTVENVDYLINLVYPGDEIPTMNRDKKAFILDKMKKAIKR